MLIGPTYLAALHEATVKNVDLLRGTMRVVANLGKTDAGSSIEFDVPILAGWSGPNGEFSGGYPEKGSTIWIGIGEGNRVMPVSFVPSNDTFGNLNTLSSAGFNSDLMAVLRPGRWITQVRNNNRILVDPNLGFQAGSPSDFFHADPNKSIVSYTFKQSLGFTEAHRSITGIVKRDLTSNSNRNITGSALTSHSYEDTLEEIGLDPLSKAGVTFTRNPPLIESREIIYEFANSFGFTDNVTEAARYDLDNPPEISSTFKRRDSRADALSLSLVSPNQLLESIKGTVVDVYGNILDINRFPLPSGSIDSLSFRNAEQNTADTFNNLIEQQRKSIAYHFELNARKSTIPDKISLDSPKDYARDRSRFFIDVDKEGQIKFNIPSSSEIGNVPLLTRYENFTTLHAFENDDDPTKFIRNVEHRDIFHEGFGIGVVGLTGADQTIEGFAAPDDRLKNEPIKLGTAYHDINKTVETHQISSPVFIDSDNKLNIPSEVPVVEQIVSTNITVSGDDANAGGRSITGNIDGFTNLSFGANTIDRQSLWLDFAGGIVANHGRDRFNRSYVGRYDGDVLIQIGGTTVGNDSRFEDLNNALRDGALDIRLISNNQITIVRIDAKGVKIFTPGQLDIESAGNMRFKSLSDMYFDAKGIYFYADSEGRGRWVRRAGGQTIG